ncbi:MAG: DHH family phosphoesterase [Planctomycetota bacterium]
MSDFLKHLEHAAQNVLLTTHVRPDGDALGTTAALSLWLEARGKTTTRLLLSAMPNKYRFVYDDAGLEWAETVPDLTPFDTLLVCDTGTWNQLPGLEAATSGFGGKKLVLDHHVTQQDWADAKLVDTEAAAAAEIAATVIGDLEPATASAIYVGLVSDTGWFRYPNTRAQTLRLAADCIAAGIDADAIYRRLYLAETEKRLRLQADVQQSLEIHGDLAILTCTAADFTRHGADVPDTEDVVNWPLQIATVKASVLLVETEQGTKLSFRSKTDGPDVAALAQKFNGGGHVRAAGARIEASLATAKQQVIASL